MMTRKGYVGSVGEDIACEYLREKGLKILYRNLREVWGEIDVLARGVNGELVFAEVKTLWGGGGLPEQNYTYDKSRKTKRASQFFMQRYPELVGDAGARIDLIAIHIRTQFLEDWHADCDIRHYENV